MNEPSGDEVRVSLDAQAEFDGLVDALRSAGVEVVVYQDERGLPDCVFPNNWMSWHSPAEGGSVVITYPMCDELRRAERSGEVLDVLSSGVGEVGHLDLSGLEDDGEILEGTGSLVLDRVQGIAYGCESPRTTAMAVEAWCDGTGYEAVVFDALDRNGDPIYHTNVLMSVGSRISVVCGEAIVDAADRDRVLDTLRAGGREVIEIGVDQMGSFCGNILELADREGEPIFAMSSRAYEAFTVEQQERLKALGRIVYAAIPTIENVGGGSVRCMIAEVGRI